MSFGPVLDIALTLTRALRARGFPAAIGGALALGLWGVPRGTKDIDLNVFVAESRHGDLLSALEALGCQAPNGSPWTDSLRAEFLRSAREGEVAVAWKDGFRVDVFVPSIPFYADVERTVREVPGPDGQPTWLISPESTCVFKLLFFRDKDVVDLRRLVARQGRSLDHGYVRSWMVDMVGESDDRIATWDEIVKTHGSP